MRNSRQVSLLAALINSPSASYNMYLMYRSVRLFSCKRSIIVGKEDIYLLVSLTNLSKIKVFSLANLVETEVSLTNYAHTLV